MLTNAKIKLTQSFPNLICLFVFWLFQGYGDTKARSSTTPQEVKCLHGAYIHSVACGYGHTLMIARDDSDEDKAKIEKLPEFVP